MWKYNSKDLDEAKLWPEYMKMYEAAFEGCNVYPWTIVPSDQNWYKEYIIAEAVLQELKRMDMSYPGL